MGSSQAIVFKKLEWRPELAAVLRPALGEYLPFIRDEIKAGECEAWLIEGRGHMVTRLENGQQSKTLVIVAGVGQKAREVFSILPKVAKANGAKWIRVHSRRKGFKRYLSGLGYSHEFAQGENIFYKKVH